MNDFLREQQHQNEILEHLTDKYNPDTTADVLSGAWLFHDWLESLGVPRAVKVVRELILETNDATLKACLEAVLDELKRGTTHEFQSAFMNNMCGYSFQKFVEEIIARRVED